ncbi:energy transducer TonB [Pseudopedobacter sp.]|uniref:energy transducer TonB n=1 Tax=Pseudopedobacter sp. TaxID=1936787 RepID=UPI00333FBFC8
MKFLLVFICGWVTLFTLAFSQETKLRYDSEQGEKYYVLKSNKKIKHGPYEKTGIKKLYVKGTYTNGERSGIWEFHNIDGKLLSKYDFDNKTLLLFNTKNETKPTKKINTVDTLTRPAIFIGGNDYIISAIATSLKYPLEARSSNAMGRVTVHFTVNKDGHASNYHVKEPLGYGLDEEAIRVIESIPNLWLPALNEGKPVDSELSYPVVFRLEIRHSSVTSYR